MTRFFLRGLRRPLCYIAAYAACKRGATAIEYGLIVAGIAVGVGIAVAFFGQTLKGYFEYFTTLISSAG